MDDELVQEALFQIEGPNEDGCMWACPSEELTERFAHCTAYYSPRYDLCDDTNHFRRELRTRCAARKT